MTGFGRSGAHSSYMGQTETKSGKVMEIKTSPDGERRRLVVRERKGSRKSFNVDIPYAETKGVERKEEYDFEVYQIDKDESRYGGGMGFNRQGKNRDYLSDDEPMPYGSGSRSQFASFGSNAKGSDKGFTSRKYSS